MINLNEVFNKTLNIVGVFGLISLLVILYQSDYVKDIIKHEVVNIQSWNNQKALANPTAFVEGNIADFEQIVIELENNKVNLSANKDLTQKEIIVFQNEVEDLTAENNYIYKLYDDASKEEKIELEDQAAKSIEMNNMVIERNKRYISDNINFISEIDGELVNIETELNKYRSALLDLSIMQKSISARETISQFTADEFKNLDQVMSKVSALSNHIKSPKNNTLRNTLRLNDTKRKFLSGYETFLNSDKTEYQDQSQNMDNSAVLELD
jgi:hypothetical protein